MSNKKNIYFCQQYEESWSGGLLLFAKDKKEASDIYEGKEHKKPYLVKLIKPTKSGIIYDEEGR